MPFKSEKQRKKFHAMDKEGKISPAVASKGLKLPPVVKKVKKEQPENKQDKKDRIRENKK